MLASSAINPGSGWFRDRRSLKSSQAKGTFSQYGEDRFVLEYFNGKKSGRYLDIGASHPFRISNTYLLYTNGWTGVTVEPIPRLVSLHCKWRPKDEVLPVAIGADADKLKFFEMTPSVLSTLDKGTAETYVNEGRARIFRTYDIPIMSITDVLERAFKGGHVDFLSIDVEGLDASLLESADLAKWRPSLICIETNDDAAKSRIETSFSDADYRIVREVGDNLIAAPNTPSGPADG